MTHVSALTRRATDMDPHPPTEISILSHLLPGDAGFPNNPRLPLLIYQQVFPQGEFDVAAELERLFKRNQWKGQWRNGVFSYHHFHSNAHEVLGICRGSAELQFGGPGGPILTIDAGDVAILPAGTGHKRVKATEDFLVVGAYPSGQEDYDLLRGDPEERPAAEERIAAVSLPQNDPVYGPQGPLFDHWEKG
ncbi:MAG TPA: hypothetical protein VNQ76_13620 [Planctomicrobium sp.]|nr:hypothetical protein [Planctomicrobium sp.]